MHFWGCILEQEIRGGRERERDYLAASGVYLMGSILIAPPRIFFLTISWYIYSNEQYLIEIYKLSPTIMKSLKKRANLWVLKVFFFYNTILYFSKSIQKIMAWISNQPTNTKIGHPKPQCQGSCTRAIIKVIIQYRQEYQYQYSRK
jgi:hypothetical protein